MKGWSQASLAARIQVRTYRNIFLEFGIKIEKSRMTIDTLTAHVTLEGVMNDKWKLREVPKALGYLFALAAAGALGAAVILACSNPATPKPLEPTTSKPPGMGILEVSGATAPPCGWSIGGMRKSTPTA